MNPQQYGYGYQQQANMGYDSSPAGIVARIKDQIAFLEGVLQTVPDIEKNLARLKRMLAVAEDS